MGAEYATITAKGQITLPVSIRRAWGLQAGQKVSVKVSDNVVVIERAADISTVRSRLREEVQSSGMCGHIPTSGEGWEARVEDYRGDA